MTRCNDRHNPSQVQAIYYREIEKVAAAATGATRTFCNGHVIRKSGDSDGPLGKLFTAIAGPIQFVHNDFCDDYNQNIINAFKDDPVPVGSSMSHSGINNADSYRASSGGGGGAKPGSATFGIVDQMKAAGVTAEELANSRMVMVNSWRNVSNQPLTRFPLGVYGTIPPAFFVLLEDHHGGVPHTPP